MPDYRFSTHSPHYSPMGTKQYDLIAIGRAGLDLYAQESNKDFADVSLFEKHVGGSSANTIAAAAHRSQNGKDTKDIEGAQNAQSTQNAQNANDARNESNFQTALITKVSDDMVGRYIIEWLRRWGINCDGIQFSHGIAKTSLALTEIKPQSGEVVIYRNSASDMQMHKDQFAKGTVLRQMLMQARCVVFSGTGLSSSRGKKALKTVLSFLKRNNTLCVLDVDYRKDGFVNTRVAQKTYWNFAKHCDVIIGNEEEMGILVGLPQQTQQKGVAHSDLQQSNAEQSDQTSQTNYNNRTNRLIESYHHLLSRCRPSLIIEKQGAQGLRYYYANKTSSYTAKDIKTGSRSAFRLATILKPFGAGDAFAGNLLYELLNDNTLKSALTMASAAAAIVVSKRSCSSASPSTQELKTFISYHQNTT